MLAGDSRLVIACLLLAQAGRKGRHSCKAGKLHFWRVGARTTPGGPQKGRGPGGRWEERRNDVRFT